MSETMKVIAILLGFVFALYAAFAIWFSIGFDF